MILRQTISVSKSLSALALAGSVLVPDASWCQGVYNDSNIFINGISVYVDGEVINAGKLDNDGILALTGDWKSEGNYKGKGTLELYGNTPQKISHYAQSLETLLVNGWGTKYINGAMNVDSQLQLQLGIVEVSDDDALKLSEDAAVVGGSADSYIDGALTVTGTGYKYFPVGKNGTYAPIEFLNVKAEAAEYSVEVFEDAPSISVEDVLVRTGLYWQRTDIAGIFGSSPVAVDFEASFFENPDQIIMLTGTSWMEPFATVTQVEKSSETNKLITTTGLTAPIIMLGEVSQAWKEADFYFSTALSPHAARTENEKVKIFGDRLDHHGFRFQVFDRWGKMIYENNSLEDMKMNGWDGRIFGGTQLATGTYPYKLSAVDKTGRTFEKKGVITIIN